MARPALLDRFPKYVSSWNRTRKWELFRRRFPLRPETTILDVGFSPIQYQQAENFFESYYPWPERITALCVEDLGDAAQRYPDLTLVHYAGAAMPFEDQAFDVVWSNAVVEHVGTFDDQIRFLSEVDRVGCAHFVTTPNRWFPIEVHTHIPLLHWLPHAGFDRYLRWIGRETATSEHLQLLSRRKFRQALEAAGVRARIVPNRVAGIPMDFVAIW